MSETGEAASLGDAHGEWYWCFKHDKAETKYEDDRRDRLGPYPTREAAEHWRDQVEARNEAWEAQDEDEDA